MTVFLNKCRKLENTLDDALNTCQCHAIGEPAPKAGVEDCRLFRGDLNEIEYEANAGKLKAIKELKDIVNMAENAINTLKDIDFTSRFVSHSDKTCQEKIAIMAGESLSVWQK